MVIPSLSKLLLAIQNQIITVTNKTSYGLEWIYNKEIRK